MIDARRYAYRVLWSEEDGEYAGLCAEFPSLSWLDACQEEALVGIVRLVDETVKDMEKNGEAVPAPLSTAHYSGKFLLRTTPESTGIWHCWQPKQV